jgi:hypothetical protein
MSYTIDDKLRLAPHVDQGRSRPNWLITSPDAALFSTSAEHSDTLTTPA